MTPWQQVLEALAAARAAHERYRAAAAAHQAAAELTAEQRNAAAMAGDFHVSGHDTESGRQHLAQLQQTARAEIEGHLERARSLRQQIAEQAERAAQAAAPSGAEGVAHRVEVSDAAARVRPMLDQGISPTTIAARAVTLGDRATIAALRREVEWRTVREPDLGEVMTGFEAEGPPSLVLRRIDEAELPLLSDAERAAREVELQAQTGWPAIELEAEQLVDKLAEGRSLADAVSLRLVQPPTALEPSA